MWCTDAWRWTSKLGHSDERWLPDSPWPCRYAQVSGRPRTGPCDPADLPGPCGGRQLSLQASGPRRAQRAPGSALPKARPFGCFLQDVSMTGETARASLNAGRGLRGLRMLCCSEGSSAPADADQYVQVWIGLADADSAQESGQVWTSKRRSSLGVQDGGQPLPSLITETPVRHDSL